MSCQRCGRSCHGSMCRDCDREQYQDTVDYEYDVDEDEEEEQ